MAAAHRETVVAVVAEAEVDVGENRDSGGSIDCDCQKLFYAPYCIV